jgi:hypothetical protein
MAARASEIVMFGGSDGTNLATDTWTFDGTWTNTGASGPSGRIGHAMATQGSVVLLYGGENTAETWSFDGASWTEVTASSAAGARSDHAMATLP